MNILDTVIWLANFPATHGYAMVFIAAFGAVGLLSHAFGGASGSAPSRLQLLREERGQAVAVAQRRPVLLIVRQWAFRVLALVVLAGGVIGLLSLIMGPITSGYIHANGVAVEAEKVDGAGREAVRFTAEDGETYTLPFPFFTPPSYPGDTSLAFAGEKIVVRYLPDHPQAYILDTDESLDSWGDPIG
ncbi:hypothetical protein [Microbacterium sp. gxy059]|uniref:hypothetical protein n=1 Tax=Microbacterium sp. gxy059 TaxID=2957199 RepID=UPI003D98755D